MKAKPTGENLTSYSKSREIKKNTRLKLMNQNPRTEIRTSQLND